MSYKRTRNLYEPNSSEPFKLSRSKIELFLESPRMFYLDRRLGISKPSMPGFSLNSAVDELLKREFDLLRKKGAQHEIHKKYKIDAVPYSHPDLDQWRNNFVGKQYLHEQTNLLIFGAVDDVWINKKGELIVVDYKSTSTSKDIDFNDEWKQAYKRQMDIYRWIFKKSGFKVAKEGFFVYANASKDRPRFDGKLVFELTLHEHIGDTEWVEDVIFKIKKILESDTIPPSDDSEYSQFIDEVAKVI